MSSHAAWPTTPTRKCYNLRSFKKPPKAKSKKQNDTPLSPSKLAPASDAEFQRIAIANEESTIRKMEAKREECDGEFSIGLTSLYVEAEDYSPSPSPQRKRKRARNSPGIEARKDKKRAARNNLSSEEEEDPSDVSESDSDYNPDASRITAKITKSKELCRPWPPQVTGAILQEIYTHYSKTAVIAHVTKAQREISKKYSLPKDVIDILWRVMIGLIRKHDDMDWTDEPLVLECFQDAWPEYSENIQGRL